MSFHSGGNRHFPVGVDTDVILGFLITTITLFQSLGKASKASVLVLFRQIALFVPMAILLPKVGGLGIHGVFMAPALTDGIIFIAAVILVVTEFRNLSNMKKGAR